MRKTGLLNTGLIAAISAIGHTQYIVIGDAGLPIPDRVPLIDLALKPGIPSFTETVEAVLEEMVVEKYILTTETEEKNPSLDKWFKENLDPNECEYISHETLKKMSEKARAIIRTGETEPYANMILVAGVNF